MATKEQQRAYRKRNPEKFKAYQLKAKLKRREGKFCKLCEVRLDDPVFGGLKARRYCDDCAGNQRQAINRKKAAVWRRLYANRRKQVLYARRYRELYKYEIKARRLAASQGSHKKIIFK